MNTHEPDLRMPDDRPLREASLALREQHLVTEITRPTVRRTRARVTVLAMATGVTLIGGTAAALGAWSPTTDSNLVRCYSTVSGDESEDFPGTSVAQADGLVGTTESKALGGCEFAWRTDAFGTNVDESATHPVPPLVACRLHNGIPAVFPGDSETCSQLGLPRLGTP